MSEVVLWLVLSVWLPEENRILVWSSLACALSDDGEYQYPALEKNMSGGKKKIKKVMTDNWRKRSPIVDTLYRPRPCEVIRFYVFLGVEAVDICWRIEQSLHIWRWVRKPQPTIRHDVRAAHIHRFWKRRLQFANQIKNKTTFIPCPRVLAVESTLLSKCGNASANESFFLWVCAVGDGYTWTLWFCRKCSNISLAVIKKSLLLRWQRNLNEYSVGVSVPECPFETVDFFKLGVIDTCSSRLTCSVSPMNSGEAQTRGSSALGGTAISASNGTWS